MVVGVDLLVDLQLHPRIHVGLDDLTVEQPDNGFDLVAHLVFRDVLAGGSQVTRRDISVPDQNLVFPAVLVIDVVLHAHGLDLTLVRATLVVTFRVIFQVLLDDIAEEVIPVCQLADLMASHDDALVLAVHLVQVLGAHVRVVVPDRNEVELLAERLNQLRADCRLARHRVLDTLPRTLLLHADERPLQDAHAVDDPAHQHLTAEGDVVDHATAADFGELILDLPLQIAAALFGKLLHGQLDHLVFERDVRVLGQLQGREDEVEVFFAEVWHRAAGQPPVLLVRREQQVHQSAEHRDALDPGQLRVRLRPVFLDLRLDLRVVDTKELPGALRPAQFGKPALAFIPQKLGTQALADSPQFVEVRGTLLKRGTHGGLGHLHGVDPWLFGANGRHIITVRGSWGSAGAARTSSSRCSTRSAGRCWRTTCTGSRRRPPGGSAGSSPARQLCRRPSSP